MVKYRAPASINHKLTHKTRLGRYTLFCLFIAREGIPPHPLRHAELIYTYTFCIILEGGAHRTVKNRA